LLSVSGFSRAQDGSRDLGGRPRHPDNDVLDGDSVLPDDAAAPDAPDARAAPDAHLPRDPRGRAAHHTALSERPELPIRRGCG